MRQVESECHLLGTASSAHLSSATGTNILAQVNSFKKWEPMRKLRMHIAHGLAIMIHRSEGSFEKQFALEKQAY